jgi:hypothetical protein
VVNVNIAGVMRSSKALQPSCVTLKRRATHRVCNAELHAELHSELHAELHAELHVELHADCRVQSAEDYVSRQRR